MSSDTRIRTFVVGVAAAGLAAELGDRAPRVRHAVQPQEAEAQVELAVGERQPRDVDLGRADLRQAAAQVALQFELVQRLLALDTVDQFANNVGIVLSAILMTVLIVWVVRKGELLRSHLNAVSTFPLGRWWLALLGIVSPIFLLVMLGQKLVSLVSDGYEGLPGWYVGLFGWGTIAFVALSAFALAALPWKGRDEPDFRPWPALEEEHRS